MLFTDVKAKRITSSSCHLLRSAGRQVQDYELIFFFCLLLVFIHNQTLAQQNQIHARIDMTSGNIVVHLFNFIFRISHMTTSLASLKFVTSKRPTQIPSIQLRRNKLVAKLHEQIQLVTAKKDGVHFAPLHFRSVRDRDTGELKRIETAKRIRPWFFTSDNGKICVQIKYGSKVIDVSGKNKPTIELTNTDDLIKTLELIKVATLNGELDTLLESAGLTLRNGFVK